MTGNSDSGRAARRDRGKRSLPRFGLRNWRVRWRLTALILVPTIAGVLLAGARVVASIESVGDYDRTAVAAEQSGRIRDLLEALGLERDRGGWYYARKQAKTLAGPFNERKAAVNALIKTVEADLAAMDDSYGPRVVSEVERASYQLKALPALRREKDPLKYEPLMEGLLRLHEELSLLSQDPEIVGDFRGLSTLARAKEEISRQRIRLLTGVYQPQRVDAQEVTQFIASRARQWDNQASFGSEAGADNAQLLARTLNAEEYYRSELTKARAIVLASGKSVGAGAAFRSNLIEDVKEWFDDNTWTIDQISTVEAKVAKDVLARSNALKDAEVRNAIFAGGAILALLVLVLLFTVLIARSMVTPLRRLRTEALDIAGFQLPDVVRKLRLSGDSAPPEIRPIDIEGKDEIGDVAQAFDEVHRQAVRLAAEEADLRSNISSMFVNLSRRTQTLVERQISLIDGLEKGEEDGARLADLFKLDHLATRMRRNSENLLVLAGHEPTRRRSQPAKLVDVVRASLSEVEDYERVQVKVHRATSVVGSAANDLVHLVAELVENAIQFSPRNTKVIVSSSIIEGGGALLSVSDLGISMTEEELAEANRRLAEPPVVDVQVSRRMGLFVVGRLALRHGIRVQLRRGEGTGLIAMVLLPPTLLPDGSQPPVPQRPAFGGSSPAPAFGAAAQNSQFSRPGGHESFDTSGFGADSGPVRQGLGAFTSDTGAFTADSGAFRQGPLDNSGGSFPSYPSMGQHPSFPTGEPPRQPFPSVDQRPPHPSFPSVEQPSYPSFPSVEQNLPRREPRPQDTGAFSPPPHLAAPYESAERQQGYSSWTPRVEEAATASMPAVNVSPMEPEQEEFLPIFASIDSAWFRKPVEEAEPEPVVQQAPEQAVAAEPAFIMPAEPRQAEAPPAQAVPSSRDVWQTPADAGWRAAAAASDPSLGGITSAGLPKRTPKANLVPGTASQPAQPLTPMPPVSADRVRNRMSSYQQGVRRGRAEVRDESSPGGMEKEEERS